MTRRFMRWLAFTLVLCACSDGQSEPSGTALNAVALRLGYGIICVREGVAPSWSCGGYGFPGLTPDGLYRTDSLGHFDRTLAPLATPVPFTDLQLGLHIACGLDAEGTAWCWGRNRDGLLGTGSSSESVTGPEPVQGGHRFRSLALSPLDPVPAMCGIDESATIWCWGANFRGQLGVGDSLGRKVPAAVIGPSGVTTIMAPQSVTCALAEAGVIWCWGDNGWGQVGVDVPAKFVYSPMIAVPDLRFRAVVNSWNSGCGIEEAGGALWCWGQMGLPASADFPLRRLAADTAFTELASGGLTLFGRTASGDVYYWAEMDGDYIEPTPHRLPFPLPMTSIAAGAFPADENRIVMYGVCGIAVDAQVYCASTPPGAPRVWRLTRAGNVPIPR